MESVRIANATKTATIEIERALISKKKLRPLLRVKRVKLAAPLCDTACLKIEKNWFVWL